jgi:hypothetical protein
MAESNGRINLDERPGAGGGASVPGFGWRSTGDCSAKADMIRGNWESNALNQTFFSPENVQIVQNGIRRKVYDDSKGEFLIDPQSADELLIVMRSMYLTYGRNEPEKIVEQITDLNKHVVEWCAPRILSEVSMYRTYRKDIQTLPVPMSHPVNISGAGTKSKPLPKFF